MPQEKLLLALEPDPLDSVPFPHFTKAEVDRIISIGDRTKDILLAKLGDDYSIDAVDDDFFSWNIRQYMCGVVGGYFYYAPTGTWTRIACHEHLDEVLVAPVRIRELVRTEVNQQLWAIKGSSNQGPIA